MRLKGTITLDGLEKAISAFHELLKAAAASAGRAERGDPLRTGAGDVTFRVTHLSIEEEEE